MTAPKRKPRKPSELVRIEERLAEIEAKVDAIGGLLVRGARPGRAAVPGDGSGIAYRSGRWHLRDGDGYDKPPV